MRIRWIRENSSNLWKFRSRNEFTIRIFKNRTHESGFANLWSQDSWYDTKRIFLESGFVTTIRNEPMDSRNESTFLRISYTIPASLWFLHFFPSYRAPKGFDSRYQLDYRIVCHRILYIHILLNEPRLNIKLTKCKTLNRNINIHKFIITVRLGLCTFLNFM